MYSKKYLSLRKRIAKMLVREYLEPGVASKNLTSIYRAYGKWVLGVEYDTFRSYVNTPDDQLGETLPPGYVLTAYRLMGYLRDCENRGIALLENERPSFEAIDAFLLGLPQARIERTRQEQTAARLAGCRKLRKAAKGR